MVFAAVSPGHFRSQVEPLQLTEHDGSVQVTWQVAPLLHETLPLLPTEMVQVA